MAKIIAIVGNQWGDEGKGSCVAGLVKDANICVRSQGGNNAGHSFYDSNGNKIVVNIAPSGVIFSHVTNVIGNGCVTDLEVLDENLRGVPGKLLISDATHFIFDYHRYLDGAQEYSRGKGKIGTTQKGIGPAYADKINRKGIRAGLLLHSSRLEEALENAVEQKNRELEFWGQESRVDFNSLLKKMRPLFEKYAPMVTDTVSYLHQAVLDGKRIVLEGAQGAMLDIDHGTYPFVTSSNTTTAGSLTGTGIPPRLLDLAVGVTKAYTSRVGEGIFPTEGELYADIKGLTPKNCGISEDGIKVVLNGDVSHPQYDKLVSRYIRQNAEEFGATTGRPRRVGWLDTVALRKTAMINGLEYQIVTRLDNLDGVGALKICTKYENPSTRQILHSFPSDQQELEGFKPVYEIFPGWKSTKDIKTWKELPPEAKDYLKVIEDLTDVDICGIKNGKLQEDYILVKNIWEQ